MINTCRECKKKVTDVTVEDYKKLIDIAYIQNYGECLNCYVKRIKLKRETKIKQDLEYSLELA